MPTGSRANSNWWHSVQKRNRGLQHLAHADNAKLDPLLILRTKPETKAANSPRFTFRDRLH